MDVFWILTALAFVYGLGYFTGHYVADEHWRKTCAKQRTSS